MTDAPTPFADQFNKTVDECAIFACITRDSDLQRQAGRRLDDLLTAISTEKASAIMAGNEDYANLLLGCECAAKCVAAEIRMWLLLKEGQPDGAWDQLVTAQDSASGAVRAHAGFAHLEKYARRLDAIEHLVFPPQVFLSTGFIVKSQICSICGQEYEDCEHIKRRPYVGTFCTVTLIPEEVDHVSFVDNPANKHCRVLQFSDEGGYRNRMTWKVKAETKADGEVSGELKAEGIVTTIQSEVISTSPNSPLAIQEHV